MQKIQLLIILALFSASLSISSIHFPSRFITSSSLSPSSSSSLSTSFTSHSSLQNYDENKREKLATTLLLRAGSKKKSSKKNKKQSKSKKLKEVEEVIVEESNEIQESPNEESDHEETKKTIFSPSLSSNSLLVEDSDSDNPSLVFLSPEKLQALGLTRGQAVRLRGKKKRLSVATVEVDDRLSLGKLRLSKPLRANLCLHLGDTVQISPISNLRRAKSVRVAPFKDSMEGLTGDLVENFVRPYFFSFSSSRPIHSGDIFVARGGMRAVEFKILEITAEEEKSKDKKKKTEQSQENEEEEEEEDFLEYSIIDEDTEILYDPSDLLTLDDDDRFDLSNVGYEDVGGCGRQLQAIREMVELPLRHPQIFRAVGITPPRGVLIHGPNGSGKTLLSKAIAKETGAYFLMLQGSELMAKSPGEAEAILKKVFEEAQKHSPAIIFIDDIDQIATKKDAKGGVAPSESEKKVLSQFLTLLDSLSLNSNIVLLATTSKVSSLDSSLRRYGRFDREILMTVPDEEDRLEILRIKTRNMKLSSDLNLSQISKNTQGYIGSDLSQLCMEAAYQAIREKLEVLQLDNLTPQDVLGGNSSENSSSPLLDISLLNSIEVNMSHFQHALKLTNPSALREHVVKVPETSWKDIGGLEDVKKELYETIQYPIEHADKFAKFGMKPSKGVLFYGPPGCGKTLLAKAIANECQANFISIKGPELLSMWFGESEANIRELFDKARASAPCILFFDEIDSIAKARGSGGGGGGDASDRVINQILTEIDGVASSPSNQILPSSGSKKTKDTSAARTVFIIGATNRPDILDNAITRPGRLDQLVYIPLPDRASRLEIFKSCLRKSSIEPDVDLDQLADSTEGFSGADINEVCQKAARYAVRECISEEGKLKDKLKEEKERLETEGIKYDEEELIQRIFDVEDPVPAIRRDHFEEAMSKARKSVSEKELQQYEQFKAKIKADLQASGSLNFRFKDKKEEAEEKNEGEVEDEKGEGNVGEAETETEDDLYQ